jgi:hypothetical protein
MRKLAGACSLVAAVVWPLCPAPAVHAGSPGLSDVYLFTADVEVTPVGGSAPWVDATTRVAYTLLEQSCSLAYSGGEVAEELSSCDVHSTTFSLPGPGVCGGGIGSGSSLVIDETGTGSDTTTVPTYTVAVLAGLAVVAGGGTEKSGGRVTVVGAFTMVPAPLPAMPQASPPALGACDSGFVADGAFAAVETG